MIPYTGQRLRRQHNIYKPGKVVIQHDHEESLRCNACYMENVLTHIKRAGNINDDERS